MCQAAQIITVQSNANSIADIHSNAQWWCLDKCIAGCLRVPLLLFVPPSLYK
jgi:hypothetical protein